MWREKQVKGASLTDEAYRKACSLPGYSQALLKEWKYVISLTSYGMPLFCETRATLYNIWTMEEKLTWIDRHRVTIE
jgi:hypothetical protein